MANIEIQDTDENDMVEHQGLTEQLGRNKKRGSPRLMTVIVVLVVIGLIAGLAFLLNDRRQLKGEVAKLSQVQQTDPDSEDKQLIAAVGRLIEVPIDESPTVATVVDAEKVKTQAFFINAQNGDKVLLYTKASKAIIYRPSTNKIIEVAPVNLGNTQAQGTTTAPKKN